VPSGAFVLRQLAEQGLDEAFLDGNLRALRAAALLPIGRKGPGKAILHWQAADYARYIIALAAAGPTSAVATVEAIASLPFSRYTIDTGDDNSKKSLDLPPIGRDLADYLAHLIESTAADIKARRQDTASDRGTAKAMAGADTAPGVTVIDPAIIIWLEPNRVELAFYDERDHAVMAEFRDPPPEPIPGQNALMTYFVPRARLWVQRVTRIPYDIIAACAELLAMNPETTSADQTTGETPSGGSPADTITTATNENAPDPARSEASIRNSQPRANATETLHTSEVREDGKSHQVPFGMRGRLPLQSRQDRSQHALHFA
jgi:hypothetical protein